MALRKSIKFLFVNIQDLKVTGSELRLFSLRKNAAYFYKLIKIQKFNWGILKFNQYTLSLARINLCFSRPNYFNNTSKAFDEFLVNSRSQIQNYTKTRHIRLQDFPDGKILKGNRRNNLFHYWGYQKDEKVHFKLDPKHRKNKVAPRLFVSQQSGCF